VRKVQLAGGDVFTVTAVSLPVYTVDMRGFFDREHNEEWTWRWMGPAGSWTIVNTSGQPVTAALDIEMGAFDVPRRLDLLLDRRLVQTLGVDPPRRTYRIGPLTLSPGKHELVLHPAAAATVADAVLHNGDGRPLTFAVGRWRWTIEGRP
jgi:hypothetical protein